MDIDWTRMAEPQEDQYDTGVIWERVTTTITPLRREPHARRPIGGAPAIFDGAVAVRCLRERGPRYPVCENAPLDHPHIAAAVELVRRWPAVFEQYRRLMDSFHPLTDTSIPPEKRAVSLGSSSHCEQAWFGTMYATVDDPLGLAQAFVHEMAHNKLFGLGLYLERSTSGLIVNPPDRLFNSPIRKDRLRPMTAVFHAQYSFMHVTELDIRMIESATDDTVRRRALHLLRRNVRRMMEGDEELRAHVQVDEAGACFMDGFQRWSERVLGRGNALLSEHRDVFAAW